MKYSEVRNRYSGKYFSILGDSISTLEGYLPEGYHVFYTGKKCEEAGIYSMKDTWWGQVILELGGRLLVNSSWSGSRVTRAQGQVQLFPSACSDERTGSLHRNGIKPDVILVFIGVNDWAFGTREEDTAEAESFSWAYNRMLASLRHNYEEAEIWCCTLSPSCMVSKPSFHFPYTYQGRPIEQYNEAIRHISRRWGCGLIDHYAYAEPYDSLDGTHPTKKGMTTLGAHVIDVLGSVRCPSASQNRSENGAFSLGELEEKWPEKGMLVRSRYKILEKNWEVPGKRGLFTALDTETGKEVCIRIWAKAESIRQEISNQALSMLSHPGLAAVYERVEGASLYYMVREYISGISLHECLQTQGAQPVQKVIRWATQLCDVLGYLHSQEYLYGDLKPRNILLRFDGKIILTEFELMRPFQREKTCDMLPIGTVGYAAPEQYELGPLDGRTDIYAMGKIMYALLTGRNLPHIRDDIDRLRQIDPTLPEGLEYIIDKCTQPDPDSRYRSCAELREDLEHYQKLPPRKGFFRRIFGR